VNSFRVEIQTEIKESLSCKPEKNKTASGFPEHAKVHDTWFLHSGLQRNMTFSRMPRAL
jgi:hypothetical protein